MDLQTSLRILGTSELFQNLATDALEEVAASSFRRRVARDETVLGQGEQVEAAYVVITGRIRATQLGPEGEQVILRYLGPGEVVGYAALGGAETSPTTTKAVEETHLFGWTCFDIRKLMERRPRVALNAVGILSARYGEAQTRLRELATERVERRIAHAILRLAGRAGRRTARGIEIPFPLSRQDLAEMAGTTLHTVSRTMSAWQEEGVVESGRRRVVVREPRRLQEIAETPGGGGA